METIEIFSGYVPKDLYSTSSSGSTHSCSWLKHDQKRTRL